MLPDFVELKKRRMRWLEALIKGESDSRASIAGQLPSSRQHEGESTRIQQLGGGSDVVEYNDPLEGNLRFRFDELPDLDANALARKARELGIELGSQMEQRLFRKIDEMVEDTPRSISAGNHPFSQAILLRALSAIDFDFDESGYPIIPPLITSPTCADEYRRKTQEWFGDPDFRKRFSEVIEKERIAWRDREADRKLVD